MTHAQHIRNLISVYERAQDQEIFDALHSYQRYNDLLKLVAEETCYSLRIAVGVFAALSPNNSYVSNLKNCRTLLRAHNDGKAIGEFKVNTYDSNKRKAWAMAGGADPLELFKGRKTKAFFQNILDPSDPNPITVDGHMYWIWMGRKGAVKTRSSTRAEDAPPHLGEKLYEEIADGIRFVAEIKGVVGCQAQAVLWQTWRRIHNVQGSAQGYLFAPDVYAAGGDHTHKHATTSAGI